MHKKSKKIQRIIVRSSGLGYVLRACYGLPGGALPSRPRRGKDR